VSPLGVSAVQPAPGGGAPPPPEPPPPPGAPAPLATVTLAHAVGVESPLALYASTRYANDPFPLGSTYAVTFDPTTTEPVANAGSRSILNPVSSALLSVHDTIARPFPMSVAAIPDGAPGGRLVPPVPPDVVAVTQPVNADVPPGPIARTRYRYTPSDTESWYAAVFAPSVTVVDPIHTPPSDVSRFTSNDVSLFERSRHRSDITVFAAFTRSDPG
jgi:hypothetical protein